MATPEVLKAFLEANVAAAFAIGLILILRRLVRKVFGAQVAYLLWVAAPLAATATLVPPRMVVQPAAAPDQVATGAAAVMAPLGLPLADQALALAPVAAPLDPWGPVFWIWAAGFAVMLGLLVLRQAQFLEDLEAGLAGPAVVGFLKPRIVTPADFEDRFSPRERAVVLAHERVHLDRRDAQVNALAAFVRCLCWFNPLVHLATHMMRIDQELACDAAVLQRHPKARRPYAEALLKAQLAARPLPLGCYWPGGAAHPLMERIAMLKLATPRPSRVVAGLGGVAALAIGAGFAAWAVQPAEVRLAPIALRSSSPVAPAPLAAPAEPATAVPEEQETEPPSPPDRAPAQALAPTSLDESVTRVRVEQGRIVPDYVPTREFNQAWANVDRFARANGILQPAASTGGAGHRLEGVLQFTDGASARLGDLSVTRGGAFRTLFADGAVMVVATPRGDKLGVTTLVGLIDGRVLESEEAVLEIGRTVTLPVPGGHALTVTPTSRDIPAFEAARVQQPAQPASGPSPAARQE